MPDPERWVFWCGDEKFEITDEEREWLEEFKDKYGIGEFYISPWEPPLPPKPREEWTQLDYMMESMAKQWLANYEKNRDLMVNLTESPKLGGKHVTFQIHAERNREANLKKWFSDGE